MHGELGEAVVLLGVALVLARVTQALGVPTLLGFLLGGVLVGPSGLDLIQEERIHFFAELGLVLLLFTVGLELSATPLLRSAGPILLAVGLQMGVTLLVCAAVLAGLGFGWATALLVGAAAATSSTAIMLKHLSDRGEMDTPGGAASTGMLLVQDVVVIVLLIFLPLLSGSTEAGAGLGGTGRGWTAGLLRAGLALGGLVGVTLAARYVLPWLVERVFRGTERELLALFAVTMACTGAWLADLADWSWGLGACIAGLLLAQTDLRDQLCAEITPFRDVFNALFFMSIGTLVDLSVVREQWLALAGLIVLTLVVKALICGAAVAVAGWPARVAITCGLGLATISEFGYVLVKEAASLGFLEPSMVTTFTACTAGTMVLGALLLPMNGWAIAIAARLRPAWLDRTRVAVTDAEDAPPSHHVIIVGYGVNGENLARVLRATRIPYTVVEMNRATVAAAQREGARVIVGDATRWFILERAGLATARALVVAVSEPQATRQIVAQARAARPDLYILARTRYVSELDTLYRLGARLVIPEEFETSVEIFAHVLKEFGVPDNVIEQQVTIVRAGRYGMLRGRPTDARLRAEWLSILEAAVTQTFLLQEGSLASGRTIREIALRSRTGATIVAVTRRGTPVPNPSPDFRLQAGDVLVLVGTHRQLEDTRRALGPREGEPEFEAPQEARGPDAGEGDRK